jgi:hypothetical protein
MGTIRVATGAALGGEVTRVLKLAASGFSDPYDEPVEPGLGDEGEEASWKIVGVEILVLECGPRRNLPLLVSRLAMRFEKRCWGAA